jgi:hypothetical protein
MLFPTWMQFILIYCDNPAEMAEVEVQNNFNHMALIQINKVLDLGPSTCSAHAATIALR